jgi:hypothetical protein
MAGGLPGRAIELQVASGERARRALAVHVDPPEVRVPFLVDEVVTDLLDQFQPDAEHLADRFVDSLEDKQAIDPGEVGAGGHGVEVVAVVRVLRRE